LVWAAFRRYRRRGGSDRPRYRSSRASLAPTGTVFRWSGACPRIGRCGGSGRPRHRSSRASALLQMITGLLERGLPANWALRCIRLTALSFFAGKPRSNRQLNPVGAVLARDMSGAVYQEDRVIVHRGQAPLPQGAAGRQEDLVIVYRERCSQATARCRNRAIAEGRDYRKSRMSRSSLRPTKIEIDSRITENATRMPIESISGPCPPIRAER